MYNILEDKTRLKIAEFLPGAIEQVLKSYRDFLASEVFTKTEDFKKNHEACKAAITHVELIIKLTERINQNGSEEPSEDLHAMLESAYAELEKSEEKY